MTSPPRVALIAGPMYDAVSHAIGDDVEVVVAADHLSLNAAVAQLLSSGERLDVISTHGKYAPSQRQWLRPLQELLDPVTVAALEPGAVALCRDMGDLLCVPRNVDVRVLWWRTDLMDSAPDAWADLLGGSLGFGFCGRGSGLFGSFFELVVGACGRLFDDTARPALEDAVARDALDVITALARRCPAGADGWASWHYDEVDAALRSGVVDCAASWPGPTAELRSSPLGGLLRPALYPAGTHRRVSYSGCHGWAIPTTCGDLDAAVALVERLCSPEIHGIEASLGGIPARSDVLEAIAPVDDVDAERLAVTRATIAEAMITYPALGRFPLLEETGAAAITAAARGDLEPSRALDIIQRELAAVTVN